MHTTPVRRFATTDTDEALGVLFPDPGGHLEIEPISGDFRAHMRIAELGRLRLVRAEWRDAIIHSRRRPHLGTHIPVCGNVTYEHVADDESPPGVITIGPDTSTRMRFDGPGRVLVVAAPPEVVEDAVRRSGAESSALELDHVLPAHDARAGLFSRHAQFVWNELARGDLGHAPLAMVETENALIARIAALLAPGPTPSQPATSPRVARAQEFIERNVGRPLRAAEIAQATGVSGPTLAREFRRFLGTSPVAYARSCRLDRAHRHLTCAERGETSVAAVAARWGFTHLGEFAAAYARRFGERPSETLRR